MPADAGPNVWIAKLFVALTVPPSPAAELPPDDPVPLPLPRFAVTLTTPPVPSGGRAGGCVAA
jgi:hypothetical protein